VARTRTKRAGLVAAKDETGRADLDLAVRTWENIVRGYARIGVRIERPVSLVVEPMPIMGATQTTRDGHRLHVAAHAVGSGALDGLLAHEAGHMVRAERGHPSHRPEVHRRAYDAVAVPPRSRNAFGGVAREAINHVEDVYADDLALRVLGADDRMAAFFSDWARNSARVGGDRWETVGNGVTVAFALGNLARHGIPPEDGVVRHADAFAAAADIQSFPGFVATFRDLPGTDETEPVEASIRGLLTAIASEGLRRSGAARPPG
jgi:hypothetical protein